MENLESKIFGIPGTSKIPDPDKIVRDIIKKAEREVKHVLEEAEHKIEGSVKKVGHEIEHEFKRIEREAKHGLHSLGDQIESDLQKAGDEIKDGIEDAFFKLISQGSGIIIDNLVDAIQKKIFSGPIFVKLWWFRFYIDPDAKIDTLQAMAHNPPKSKQQIVARLHDLIDDDEIEFRPEVPIIAAFGGKIKVSKIEEAIEFVAHKLGL